VSWAARSLPLEGFWGISRESGEDLVSAALGELEADCAGAVVGGSSFRSAKLHRLVAMK
jgi:hypothetical protein